MVCDRLDIFDSDNFHMPNLILQFQDKKKEESASKLYKNNNKTPILEDNRDGYYSDVENSRDSAIEKASTTNSKPTATTKYVQESIIKGKTIPSSSTEYKQDDLSLILSKCLKKLTLLEKHVQDLVVEQKLILTNLAGIRCNDSTLGNAVTFVEDFAKKFNFPNPFKSLDDFLVWEAQIQEDGEMLQHFVSFLYFYLSM